MSICQRKHFHLTAGDPSVEKLGAFFWLWKKLCIATKFGDTPVFQWNHDLWEVSGTVPKAAIGNCLVLQNRKEFPLLPDFFLKHIFILCFFFPFSVRKNISNTPSHWCDQNHQSGVGKSTTGRKKKSWKVLEFMMFLFETGWFSGSKCQFSRVQACRCKGPRVQKGHKVRVKWI